MFKRKKKKIAELESTIKELECRISKQDTAIQAIKKFTGYSKAMMEAMKSTI